MDERLTDFVFADEGRVLVVCVAKWNDHEIRFYELDHPERAPRCVPGKHFGTSVRTHPGD